MEPIGNRSAAVVTVILKGGTFILWLALVLTVVALVASPFAEEPLEVDVSWMGIGTHMTIPVSMHVDTTAHPIASNPPGIAGASLEDVRGQLRFPSEYGAFYVVNGLLLIVVIVVALWVLRELRAVFQTVRAGHPFVATNAGRLRRVAFAVIGGDIMGSVVVYLQQWYAATHFSAAGISFFAMLNIDFNAIVAGLIILAIAEVFAAGTRLDEDQSLTI
jgi:hypothetical protein